MLMFRKIIIICSILTSFADALHFKTSSGRQGYKISKTFYKFKSKSYKFCLGECHRQRKRCNSINFNTRTNECELSERKESDPMKLQTAAKDWQYIEIESANFCHNINGAKTSVKTSPLSKEGSLTTSSSQFSATTHSNATNFTHPIKTAAAMVAVRNALVTTPSPAIVSSTTILSIKVSRTSSLKTQSLSTTVSTIPTTRTAKAATASTTLNPITSLIVSLSISSSSSKTTSATSTAGAVKKIRNVCEDVCLQEGKGVHVSHYPLTYLKKIRIQCSCYSKSQLILFRTVGTREHMTEEEYENGFVENRKNFWIGFVNLKHLLTKMEFTYVYDHVDGNVGTNCRIKYISDDGAEIQLSTTCSNAYPFKMGKWGQCRNGGWWWGCDSSDPTIPFFEENNYQEYAFMIY